jgi:hypothetical protein
LGPFEEAATDLAPGDRRALDVDWSGYRLDVVRTPSDPLFEQAYAHLWKEFGSHGAMERREVITDRLAWDPRKPIGGFALRYEMIVVRRGSEIAALRDHTVILAARSPARAVVHLSHALVEPAFRGSGLAAWLRALPLRTARSAAAVAGVAVPSSMTLVAEMEHGEEHLPDMKLRLRSYGKAGFRMVDPQRARYLQPDFRSAAEIESSSVQPLPFALIVRRVGREHETEMSGAELRELVDALYGMFGVHVRDEHMAQVRALAAGFPQAHETISLLVPWRDGDAARERERRAR